MKRGQVIWGWATAVLGAAVVVLLASFVWSESRWQTQQVGSDYTVSWMPLSAGALIGLVLVVGGIAAAVTARRRIE